MTARPATASETLPLISFPCSSIHFLWQRGGEGGCRCAIPAVWGRGRGYILDTSPVSSPKNTHTHAYRQFSRQLASCARVWTAGGSRSSGREATQTQRKHTPRRKTPRGWTRDLAVRRHDFYISSFPIWIFTQTIMYLYSVLIRVKTARGNNAICRVVMTFCCFYQSPEVEKVSTFCAWIKVCKMIFFFCHLFVDNFTKMKKLWQSNLD